MEVAQSVPMSLSRVAAVLLAGGKGERLGGNTPKQFLELAGRPLYHHSLEVFERCAAIASVVLVVPALPFDLNCGPFPKVCAVVKGGETRQGSVAQGLLGLPEDAEIVLVHDAARPLLSAGLVDSLLAGLNSDCSGTIPGVPLEDAIKKASEEGFVETELDRQQVWRVQTPQAFFRRPLEESLRQSMAAGREAPDCSQMLTQSGYRVRIVPGDPLNLKVTRPADLLLAELILKDRASTEGVVQ